MTAPSRPRRSATPRLGVPAPVTPDQRHRRTARVLLVAVVGLGVALALGWLLLASPWLTVREVQVTGTSRVAVEQVVAAVDVPVGTPLARVPAGQVERRVAQLGPVAAVQVQRGWPSTLRVSVTERQAVAGLPTTGGFTLVDAGGVGFAVEPALPAGVARLEVATPGPDDPATRAALQVQSELPAGLRGSLAVVRAPSAAGVELQLADGRTIIWGRPGDVATKAAAAEALLRMPGTVFDVSAPGLAVRR